jgi:ATP-dependent Clp protease ATP-binding subunit ClpA
VGFPELAATEGSRPARSHGLLAVGRDPWTVILVEGLDAMQHQTSDLLRGLLRTGSITDGRGRRIHVSDTVVIATADLGDAGAVAGFARKGEDRARAAALRILGPALTGEFDFILSATRGAEASAERWIADEILPRLAERYRERGITIKWGDALVAWFLARRDGDLSARALERLVEESVGAAVTGQLLGSGASVLRLGAAGDELVVSAAGSETDDGHNGSLVTRTRT